MFSLSADLRDAVRALRHNLTFTIVAVVTMALGIGANTAVFSVVNAALLRPLPYADPGRLVWAARLEPAMHAEIATGADYLDWRDQARSLDGIAAWDEAPGLTLLGAADPERLVGAHVTASLLPLLGVRLARGRNFTADEARLNAPPVAIVSDRLWQRLFGPGEVFAERPLRLDAGVFTIVGVLSPSFVFPQTARPDVLLPLRLNEATERQRELMSIVHVIGRLGPEASVEQARSELTAIWTRSEQQALEAAPGMSMPGEQGAGPATFDAPVGPPAGGAEGERVVRPFNGPARNDHPGGGPLDTMQPPPPAGENRIEIRVDGPGGPGGPGRPAEPRGPDRSRRRQSAAAGGVVVRSLQEQMVGDVQPALMLLMATVGLVLLIACANVANLLLARATARSRELAVRATLGATRWRLVRQLLIESLLLSSLGAVMGIVVATWCLAVLKGLMPSSVAEGALGMVPIAIERSVLAFTCVVAVLTGIVFGAGPALVASRVELGTALKEATRSAAGSAGSSRLRRALVVGEIALAVVLLVGAGLLVRSFARLLAVDPGFRPERVVTMAVNLQRSAQDGSDPRAEPFFADVAGRIRSLPGVQSVAYGDTVPLHEYSRILMGLGVEGRQEPASTGPPPEVAVSVVSPEYFTTMGMRVVRGRAFAAGDRLGTPAVAVVNERVARQFWGLEDPIGRRLRFGPRRPDWITVVGVVADVRHDALSAEARRTMYRPFAQDATPFGFIAVRTTGEPMTVAQSVRQVIRTVDSSLAVFDVATMEQRVTRSIGGRRFGMALMLAFALLALVLAAVGLYGVLAYIVGERTREIGIRMALGAEARDVLALVMRQSSVMVVVGIAVGLVGALAAGPLLSSALYAVTPHDGVTMAAVPLLIAGVAGLATWLPARRAARVDPLQALREE